MVTTKTTTAAATTTRTLHKIRTTTATFAALSWASCHSPAWLECVGWTLLLLFLLHVSVRVCLLVCACVHTRCWHALAATTSTKAKNIYYKCNNGSNNNNCNLQRQQTAWADVEDGTGAGAVKEPEQRHYNKWSSSLPSSSIVVRMSSCLVNHFLE